MSYVIVNARTEKAYTKTQFASPCYETERGAKTACTKLNKKYGDIGRWFVMPLAEFKEKFPVKMVMVRNLMSGEMVEQAEDTPLCCDVSSETYWSM